MLLNVLKTCGMLITCYHSVIINYLSNTFVVSKAIDYQMIPFVKRNRILENDDDVFNHNAWDDTKWTDEMLEEAKHKIELQKTESRSLGMRVEEVEPQVTQKWDNFYETHKDKFFKDRQWIFSEFAEILEYLREDSRPCRIFEAGCGVGNALAHIIDTNRSQNLHIYACDLSKNAIETMKERDLCKDNVDKITIFQADICKDFDSIIFQHVGKGTLDFITLIFTLSALNPDMMQSAVNNLASLLKSNGMILFRDYAQYDLTQLRFKGKSYLKDNYYVRSDGTTSYFFTKEFIDKIFTQAGLIQVELKEDNRLLVNRLKSLKMCRCWIQAKYKKV